ncbi:hypothetical protein [Brevundimonas sp.]|uniref:hypothetical protein n=1 Tax=Brevundimonas sp. TaxID=1871086 RepID=UPI002AB95E39|nr:hypothetical protein [Brevundimonas sp.]MDZ4365029.1 hypothetical protein [Brevundimonas sp.]
MEAIRLTDPEYYGHLRDYAVEQQLAGRPWAQTRQGLFINIRTYSEALYADLASAPEKDLIEYYGAEGAFARELQAMDMRLCADFAMGNLDLRPPLGTRMEYQANRISISRLTTAKAARDRPHSHRPPTEADVVAVYQSMLRRGASEDQASTFLRQGVQMMSLDDRCTTTIAYYEAVLDQPTARAARLIAADMRANAEISMADPSPR